LSCFCLHPSAFTSAAGELHEVFENLLDVPAAVVIALDQFLEPGREFDNARVRLHGVAEGCYQLLAVLRQVIEQSLRFLNIQAIVGEGFKKEGLGDKLRVLLASAKARKLFGRDQIPRSDLRVGQ
jgi:hypothetical protein